MNKFFVGFLTCFAILNSCQENDQFNYISVATSRVEYDNQVSAKFDGILENKSSQTITESGFIVSVRPQDNNGMKLITSGPTEKSFTAPTTSALPSNKTIYVRAYVVSQGSAIYGNELTFKTSGTTNIGRWNEVSIQQSSSGACEFPNSIFSLGDYTYFNTISGLFSYNHLSKEFKLVIANNIINLTRFSFVYNGEAFLFSLDRFYKFNPVDKSLTALSPWPVATGNRNGTSNFVINDTAYIGLGATGNSYSKNFWKYDIKANSWEQAPDFPSDVRVGAFAFSVGNLGYTGGGFSQVKLPTTFFNDLWQFNSNTKKWSARQSFPIANQELIELLGTENNGLGYGYYQKKLFEYSPTFDYWEPMSTLPTSKNLCYPALFSYKGKVYLAELGDYVKSHTINLWSYEK